MVAGSGARLCYARSWTAIARNCSAMVASITLSPMVMRAPVGTTNRGAQHGQCPESFFIHVPGLKVVCVSDAYHAKGLIKSAVRDDNPVLVFEHKLLYGSKGRAMAGGIELTTHVPTEEYLVPIGKAVIKRPGDRVTVVATHSAIAAGNSFSTALCRPSLWLMCMKYVWRAPTCSATEMASPRLKCD